MDLAECAAEYQLRRRDEILARRRGAMPADVRAAMQVVEAYEARLRDEEQILPRLQTEVPRGHCWRCFCEKGVRSMLVPYSPSTPSHSDFFRCRTCGLDVEVS